MKATDLWLRAGRPFLISWWWASFIAWWAVLYLPRDIARTIRRWLFRTEADVSDSATEIVSGLPRDQHEYGIANGHSPIAERVVCVDFDSTLVTWSGLMDEKTAINGAYEFMWKLRRDGWSIVIFTSRLSVTWARSIVATGDTGDMSRIARFCVEQEQFVRKTLRRLDIPFDRITGDKCPAEWYIDDKAISFRDNWDEIYAQITK